MYVTFLTLVKGKRKPDGLRLFSQSVGAGIRASIFNRCNDATVRTREVPLVHATCNVIALSRTCSRFAK